DETREGCKVLLYVSKKEEEKWVVCRLVSKHNHELASPYSQKFLRSKRKKTEAQKNLIDLLDNSGVRPGKIASVLINQAGGVDHLNLTGQDIQNYLKTRRQKNLEKGDAQLMLHYFQKRQSENPGFFYAIQMDVESRLANCFWVDARSRVAYKNFGEVVVFDPTYLTNKYRMPFVPFTGVNNHHQSILFGCALLWDETEDTFEWLLRTWKEAMFGVAPRTIITDQDRAITNAIAKVFPNSVHHFCMWHIEKKIPEHLSHVYHQFDDFKSKFSWCIHATTTPEEFETTWAEIIKTYNLEENSWLQRIYAIREKWIPAYVRTTFCAGMSSSQRSESMNKFFEDYLNSSTPMSVFVVQYDKAIDARYDKIREKDYKTKCSRPILKTLYPMEDEAAKAYTRKIFRIFQEELIQSQKYVSEKIEVKDEKHFYKVHQFQKQKPVYIVIVTLNPALKHAVWSCHKFEFMGILCRHVPMVFIKKQILTLLTCYLLDRWTRNATKEKVGDYPNETKS
ncbi:protein FAR1-RELATED SEQUENCE 5-like, partial [Lycium barbarum]|uniref:protein FAR1-RELATED SEQUENCE 5-like n=1 Tax=Lycium barbarum TaxID=112863 RepID=UPI00293EFC06